MGFLDALSSLFSEPKQPMQGLPLKNCKNCFYSEYKGVICKQVDPPKVLASPNEAQICNAYTVVPPSFDSTTYGAINQVKTSVDAVKTASEAAKTATEAVQTAVDGQSVKLDIVNDKLDDVKGAVDNNTVSTNNVKESVDTDVLTLQNKVFVANILPSDTLLASSDDEKTAIATVYTKVKEFYMAIAGKWRIYYEYSSGGGAIGCTARIYKNGAAYGAQKSTVSGSYVSWTEDLSFAVGDFCQLYIYTSNGSYAAKARNFRLKGTVTQAGAIEQTV